MPNFSYDAFLSYKREDKRVVGTLYHALTNVGLKVWWDSMIPLGKPFGKEIEQALAASRRTLVCVTPQAIKSDFIIAEVHRSSGKIIPVLLEKTQLDLIWDAAIGKLQSVDLTGTAHFPALSAFQILCAELKGLPLPAGLPPAETLRSKAELLLTSSELKDLALLLALSLLGGSPQGDIGEVAQDLEQRLRVTLETTPSPSSTSKLEPLSRRLAGIGAVSYEIVDPRTGVRFPCARFTEPALGHEVLATAWSEFDQLREPIVSWASAWAADPSPWIRLRLALHLGVLAQSPRLFESVWRRVLRPMLQVSTRPSARNSRRFDVADAALSFAALEPDLKSSIETILNDMIADSEADSGMPAKPAPAKPGPEATGPASASAATAQLPGATHASGLGLSGEPPTAAAVSSDNDVDLHADLVGGTAKGAQVHTVARLALGYTGARYPDLAVKALRRLAERNQYKALRHVLSTSFKEVMDSGGQGEQALWDPIGILTELMGWVEDLPAGEERAKPLSIFLIAVSDLPLAAPAAGGTSLTSILQSKRGIEAMHRGFTMGLALRDTRDEFEQALRDWRDAQREEPVTPDPVLALFTCLLCGAPSDNDRARLLFIFRDHYTGAQAEALARAAPELCRKKK